jgi:hypothetical protein
MQNNACISHSLTWNPHVAKSITKSNKVLHTIPMIKKYFLANQIKTLLTSYYYLILYYNSEIWLSPYLCSDSKNKLLSASEKASTIVPKPLRPLNFLCQITQAIQPTHTKSNWFMQTFIAIIQCF